MLSLRVERLLNQDLQNLLAINLNSNKKNIGVANIEPPNLDLFGEDGKYVDSE